MVKKRLLIFFILSVILSGFFVSMQQKAHAVDEPTQCSGEIVEIGVEKKLLSFRNHSRPGTCGVRPTKIIMHTTWGITDAYALWDYFENDPEGRGGASTQFVVGKDGTTLQMLETLKDKVEIGYAVSYYNDDSISVELGHTEDFTGKEEMPKVQYDNAQNLVKKLMQEYNIPIGNIEFDTKNKTNKDGSGEIQKTTQGIFGHYQLSPDDRTDPGSGFLKDFRDDLLKDPSIADIPPSDGDDGTTPPDGSLTKSRCVVTKVGSPATSPSPPPECSNTNTETPETDSPTQPGSCGEAPDLDATQASDYQQAIRDKWSISFFGQFTAEQMRWMWEEFHAIDCTGFLQDLQYTRIEGITDGEVSHQSYENDGRSITVNSCPNDAPSDQDPTGPPNIFFNDYGESGTKGLLVHEMTHVWQTCTDNGERNEIEYLQPALSTEGGLTKYSRGECATFKPGNVSHEDHADTIAMYLNPTVGELTCGDGAPNPFASGGFPGHRSSAEQGVSKK